MNTLWIDKLFRDKDGKLAIIQLPNWSLFIWIAAVIVRQIIQGTVHVIAGVIAPLAITIWAIMEVATGTSLFRRILGALVLVVVLVGAAARLIHF